MAKIPGVHVPAKVKNYIINGNFDFWQRVEGNTTTVNSTGVTQYIADRFLTNSGGSTNKNFTLVQSSNVPTDAQSGFQSNFSYLATVSTAISSFASNDYLQIMQYRMEGYDFLRLYQKTFTIGFWISASVAGTYSLACRNNGTTQSYVTTFTVTAASTWQYVTVTVPPYTGTSGNNFTNGSGMYIDFCALGGSTYQTSTLGSWQSGSYFVASTATNFFATNGATINIAQISLVEGETSIGATGFQRAGDTISEELRMCQRYYEKSYDIGVAPGSTNEAGLTAAAALSSTVVEIPSRNYKVTKRADPNVVIYSYNGTINELSSSQNSANASSAVILRGGMSGMLDITVSGATTGNLYWFHWTSDCDL